MIQPGFELMGSNSKCSFFDFYTELECLILILPCLLTVLLGVPAVVLTWTLFPRKTGSVYLEEPIRGTLGIAVYPLLENRKKTQSLL